MPVCLAAAGVRQPDPDPAGDGRGQGQSPAKQHPDGSVCPRPGTRPGPKAVPAQRPTDGDAETNENPSHHPRRRSHRGLLRRPQHQRVCRQNRQRRPGHQPLHGPRGPARPPCRVQRPAAVFRQRTDRNPDLRATYTMVQDSGEGAHDERTTASRSTRCRPTRSRSIPASPTISPGTPPTRSASSRCTPSTATSSRTSATSRRRSSAPLSGRRSWMPSDWPTPRRT